MSKIYQAKGQTLEQQYFDLGTLFGESIRDSAKYIARSKSKLLMIRKNVAEKTLFNLRSQKIAEEFLSCLESWAKGASITIEQAMWLMADNLSGCQTAMIRYASGVSLLHTEEDFDDMSAHMTGEQVVSINDNGIISSCLAYNNLMPGAGLYGWKKDLIVAVDTLFLLEDGIDEVERPLLVNVVAWIIWRMTPIDANPEYIIKMIDGMGELIDGYAINVIRKVANKIEGYKITLARTQNKIEYLGEDVGSYLRQVNIVDPCYPHMKWASPARRMWRGGYKHFLSRLKIIDSHILQFIDLTHLKLLPDMVQTAHFQIQKTIYTDLSEAYINNNVGAVCVGLVDKIGTSVSCKLNDQKPYVELEYIDLV